VNPEVAAEKQQYRKGYRKAKYGQQEKLLPLIKLYKIFS
jgi:hypothetical protein